MRLYKSLFYNVATEGKYTQSERLSISALKQKLLEEQPKFVALLST